MTWSSHSSGGIAATQRTVGVYQYIEAWDQSITDPVTQRIRMRRDCTGPTCIL